MDTNKPLTSEIEVGSKINLPKKEEVNAPDGQYLSGWKLDTTGVIYAPESLFIIPNNNITFTAQYTDNLIPEVNLTFDLAGGSFSNENLLTSLSILAGESITIASANDVNVPDGKLALTGWLLQSSAVSGIILTPGSTYTAIENVDATFIAQYSEKPVVEIATVIINLGDNAKFIDGYEFPNSYFVNKTIYLPDEYKIIAPKGKEFKGWQIKSIEPLASSKKESPQIGDFYAPGAAYVVAKMNVVFDAVWQDINEGNGGATPPPVEPEKPTIPTEPEKPIISTKPVSPNSKLPSTGDVSIVIALVSVLTASGFIVIRKMKG